MDKLVLSAAMTLTLAFARASALADVPMPECVNNPACNQGGGCSVSSMPADASAVAVALALAGVAALFASRRQAR